MTAVGVGLTLQPDRLYLETIDPLLAKVDFVEVAPETMWDPTPGAQTGDNAFAEEYMDAARRHAPLGCTHLPFVAHGVGLSIGDTSPSSSAHREIWIDRLAQNHRRFGFRWMSDHLATTTLAGETMTLPLPIPSSPADVAAIRSLAPRLRHLHGCFALENTAHLFSYGPPLDEVRFFAAVATEGGFDAVLDLHNLWMMAANAGIAVESFVDALDLRFVVEIHVSGGSMSEASWLPSGRRMHLDSHDDAVPTAVWALLEAVGPRCPRLRGVTLERMEGSVRPADRAVLGEELERIRRTVDRW